MRFRNIFSEDARWPEGRIIVIEHQTPEILWRPELLEHPNGATALRQCLFVSQPAGRARQTRLDSFGADSARLCGALRRRRMRTMFPGEAAPPAALHGRAGHRLRRPRPRHPPYGRRTASPSKRDGLGRAFVGRAHNNGAIMALIEARPGLMAWPYLTKKDCLHPRRQPNAAQAIPTYSGQFDLKTVF